MTGGIAAYKACELVRLLVKAGHDVVPLVTRGASGSSPPRRSSRSPARSASADPYPHLARADLLVVAPLTANTLARLAHGLADDVLTEAALAHDGPVLVAPAMNARMWEHPATQANLASARGARRGDDRAGGGRAAPRVRSGMGRMAEPDGDRRPCRRSS